MAADGWKWIGSNPSAAVKIDVSQDAAVTSLQINNPSNCVYVDSNKRLNDEDCSTAQNAQICTVCNRFEKEQNCSYKRNNFALSCL